MNAYVLAIGERAARVFSWSMLATLGSGATGVTSMPWSSALNISAGTAVLEILACLSLGKVGPTGPGVTETIEDRGRP